MVLWPQWVIAPLFVLDLLGVVACLGLLIAGLLHLAKPDAGRPRTFGLKLIGIGLMCLVPLVITIMYADKLPLDF